MTGAAVAIVGGGLAGLNAARLLHRQGVGVALFEARDRFGGRILTVDAAGAPAARGFDLGPSWFWPDMQPDIAALVAEVGLESFAQTSEGDVLLERVPGAPPERYPGFAQEPVSMRLEGGTGALIGAILRELPVGCLHLGAKLVALSLEEGGVALTLATGSGETAWRADQVILALPPRLLAESVRFTPELPPAVRRLWRGTATWMAPHAKLVALYGRPFWCEAGLSGTAQSMAGPLAEIHDATTAAGQAALFGFVGLPARQRAQLGREALIGACTAQLARLFGPEAARPDATLYTDWAAEPFTATGADAEPGEHPAPWAQSWIEGPWRGRITLAGSETGRTDPGYLSGAVEASARAAAEVARRSVGAEAPG